jgi:hypothetical protein
VVPQNESVTETTSWQNNVPWEPLHAAIGNIQHRAFFGKLVHVVL